MPSFRKRGNTWTFQIETRDENNQRKQITKSGFKTKKEAVTAAAEIELQIANGEYYDIVKMSVGEFFAEWLNNYARSNLKPKTYENRKHMINARILPTLGKIKMDSLKPLMIQKMYQSLLNSGLSSSYVNTIHRLMFNAFKYALKWQIIKFNPMSGVDAPKIQKKTLETWNISQIQTFLKSTKNTPYHIAFSIALLTGMRRGEILNLKWDHVDFERKQMTVIAGKTISAVRKIAIPDILIKDLKSHKAKQNEYKLKLMSGYQDHGLIVCTSLGTPLNERNLNRTFYNELKKCPTLPKIRFHDLRHSHATMLLSLGENAKIVSERLGHSRINITLDLYSHVLPEMQQETAKRINDALSF